MAGGWCITMHATSTTGDLLEKCIASLLSHFDLNPTAGLAPSILADAETPISLLRLIQGSYQYCLYATLYNHWC